MKLAINARHCSARVTTGVQRYAGEITGRLTALFDDVVVFTPRSNHAALPKRARIVRGRLEGHLWEQIELPIRVSTAGCGVVFHPMSTAPIKQTRSVVVVHDVFPLTHPEWYGTRFSRWYRFVLRFCARRSARIITFSRWSRDEIVTALDVSADRIVVAKQGLAPLHQPATKSEVQRVRGKHRITGPYILAVGSGDPRKNVRFLARVLDAWPRADRPTLVVTGQAAPSVYRTTPLPSAPYLRTVGHVADADLRALYTGAIAFCHPSLGEGFGRPPLEAMACGTPVVTADYGAAAEVLGRAAQILPLQPDAWVHAIMTLAEDSDRRSATIEAGRAYSARFDWDTAAAPVARACREAAS